MNFNANDPVFMCLYVRTVRRLFYIKHVIPKPMIDAMNEFLHENFYPQLTKEDVSKIEDYIDFVKDDIQNAMLNGLIKADGGNRFGFETLSSLFDISTDKVEYLNQLKRDIALGRKKVDPQVIKQLEEKLGKK